MVMAPSIACFSRAALAPENEFTCSPRRRKMKVGMAVTPNLVVVSNHLTRSAPNSSKVNNNKFISSFSYDIVKFPLGSNLGHLAPRPTTRHRAPDVMS
mmetsp:Transcript_30204/g.52197  ORF Transcript_30204/g.52197 Transcript_30204/m.52197 type:complete len:98 (+) Transcript_30204:119-412(+)